MNYQIYLGTAVLNSQDVYLIYYTSSQGNSPTSPFRFSNLNIQNSKKKKTYFMVVLIFDILSQEAAAGY